MDWDEKRELVQVVIIVSGRIFCLLIRLCELQHWRGFQLVGLLI